MDRLVIVRPDGTEPVELPFDVASSTPGWSPDGTSLIACAYDRALGYPDHALGVDW